MSLLGPLGKLFGIKRAPPLTESETRLWVQLQSNRDAALQQIIPDDMKKEFLSLYSNRELKRVAREVYRKPLISQDRRGEDMKYGIAATIATRGFGRNLIVRHGIDPEDVYRIMLRGIDLGNKRVTKNEEGR